MGWKYGIIAAFVAFALMMAFFMYKMTTHKSNYVPDNYYEKGIHYQDKINATSGLQQFKPRLEFNSQRHGVWIALDSLHADSGTLTLQWPPDPSKNKLVKFAHLDNERQFFGLNEPKGSWNARLEFYFQGELHIFEHKIWVE